MFFVLVLLLFFQFTSPVAVLPVPEALLTWEKEMQGKAVLVPLHQVTNLFCFVRFAILITERMNLFSTRSGNCVIFAKVILIYPATEPRCSSHSRHHHSIVNLSSFFSGSLSSYSCLFFSTTLIPGN